MTNTHDPQMLAQKALAVARKQLQQFETLEPVFLVFHSGQMEVVPLSDLGTDWNNPDHRQAAMEALHEAVGMIQPEAIVTVTDAYLRTAPLKEGGELPTPEEIAAMPKQEAAIILVEARGAEPAMVIQPYKRTATGMVEFMKPVAQAAEASGRMTGFLDSANAKMN